MTTCAQHQWNEPCVRCRLERQIEGERMVWRWQFGRVGSEPLTDKPIAIKTKRREVRV